MLLEQVGGGGMVTKLEDDTTGEQYTRMELKREGIIGGDPELDRAGVIIGGGLYDDLDYHPEHADYEELREQLHEMVDSAVDAWEAETEESGDEEAEE